jgi:hypothetical protein
MTVSSRMCRLHRADRLNRTADPLADLFPPAARHPYGPRCLLTQIPFNTSISPSEQPRFAHVPKSGAHNQYNQASMPSEVEALP